MQINAEEYPEGTVAQEDGTTRAWEVVDDYWEHEKAHSTLRRKLLDISGIVYNPEEN